MNNLEIQIKARFNDLSNHKMFPADLDSNDFQLLEVLDWFGDIKGKSVLDVGCAKGRFSKALTERGAKVIGIDPAERFIEIAKENVKNASFKVASATNIPFANNSFDGLLCLEVLEHIPDTEKAIAEMVRVLKSRGKIIIIDKNILSLHYKYLLPMIPVKRMRELMNKWMYPRDFPFREKWFTPQGVNKILRKYCSKTEIKYLGGKRNNRYKILYKMFPFLSYDIGWRGIK